MAITDTIDPAIIQAGNASSAALEASHVFKPSKGKLFVLNVYNDKASAQYIQLHDAAALPADNAVPVFVFSLATKATQTITFGNLGRFFFNGIVVCNSSTAAAKTIGAADCYFDAQLV